MNVFIILSLIVFQHIKLTIYERLRTISSQRKYGVTDALDIRLFKHLKNHISYRYLRTKQDVFFRKVKNMLINEKTKNCVKLFSELTTLLNLFATKATINKEEIEK